MKTAEILQQMKKIQNKNSEETLWKKKTAQQKSDWEKNLFKNILLIYEDIFKMNDCLLFSTWKKL